MGSNGQTICLCMIAKNEAHVIRRCLASVRPLIDSWVVVDTGSTDGTQDIVREAMRGVPGELFERPWIDFAHNRTEALDLARPHGDYTFIIDADDTLRFPQPFTSPRLDADSYVIDIADAGGHVVYQRTQLVRSALPWCYKGVLHEFLTCDDASTIGSLPVTMVRNHDGARRRDGETYRRDSEILERALESETDPFMVSRYTFYLAQSYRDCGDRESALHHYLARAELGFWNEEIFVALLEAGRQMEALGYGFDQILETYERASAACPSRAEAAYAASHLCRMNEFFCKGCAVAMPALSLSVSPGGLFVEPWIYDYGLRDEYAVNAYWAGLHRECLATCIDLLALSSLPEADRPRIAANARFALEQIAESSPIVDPEPAEAQLLWTPTGPQGGTEIMVEGLKERLGHALEQIELCINSVPTDIKRPNVVWVHHDIDQAAVQWFDDACLVARVSCFVFVSDWQRRRYIERFRLPEERCRVLRNATQVPPERARADHGRPVQLAYASTPYRGLSVLLDAWEIAWSQLQPSQAELNIWSSHKLYGPEADDKPFEALFARAKKLPGVVYHGIVPNYELRRAFASIDILAYPSIFAETSCLVAIEAMAAGSRIICPDLGALPETTAGFARLYPFREQAEDHARHFAELMVEEIADPWAGVPVRATEQREYARSVYDWTARTAQWRNLIKEIAAH